MPRPDRGLYPNTSDLIHNRGKENIVNSFANIQEPLEPQRKSSKGGKVKSSQVAQAKNQPQPSTSSHIFPRNAGRLQVHCSACGREDHLRKVCCQDTYCTRCRTRSHTTEMCHAPTKTGRGNAICIYCGSKSHTLGKCINRPNDNREEPRSTPWNLQVHRARNTGNNNHIFDQNRDSCQQARFDERFNR